MLYAPASSEVDFRLRLPEPESDPVEKAVTEEDGDGDWPSPAA